MFYIYWFVGLLLAISVSVIMAAQYELKNCPEKSEEE